MNLNQLRELKEKTENMRDDFKARALEQSKKLVILQQIEDLLDQISDLEIELELDELEDESDY